MRSIRATRTSTQADDWALVLAAAGIPHRVARDGAAWILLVPDDETARAHAALAAFDEEARPETTVAVPARAAPELPWAFGVAVGLLILGAFAVTGPPAAGSRWFERGATSSAEMAREPWRAVTALTLHVDAVHAAGNAVATALLLPALAQQLGPGCALWSMLVAGAAANLLAATVSTHHLSVGASTATFGAIGTLAALQLFRRPAERRTRSKRWVVLVAGLVLLTMLGTGPDADVLGHALGLLAGAVLGTAAALGFRRPPGAALQWPLVALAALAIAQCWRLALGP